MLTVAFGRTRSTSATGLHIDIAGKKTRIVNDKGEVVAGPFKDYASAKARYDELRIERVKEAAAKSKRVREVYPGSEIAHLWAHKAVPSARCGGNNNFYFTGDTIYSYGSHFPIARHITNERGEAAILFTTRDYSSTTSGHKSAVRSAIPGNVPVFHVPLSGWTADDLKHDRNLKTYAENIHDHIVKAARARKSWSIKSSLESAQRDRNELLAYCAYFDLPVPEIEEIPAADENKLAELRKAEAKRLAAENADAKRRRAAAAIAEKERLADQIAAFRAGDYYSGLHNIPTMLRVVGDEVETSRGARFPVKDAKRGLHLVLAVRQAGVTWDRYHRDGVSINPRLGHYFIDSIDKHGNVKAGCHNVPFEEIERIIPELDHNPTPAAPDTEDREAA